MLLCTSATPEPCQRLLHWKKEPSVTPPDRAEANSRRGRLSVHSIVDEAMQLARIDGVAGLSMRKLAARLGVEAMSLYYHVPSKAALQVLMADRSAAAVLAAHSNAGEWSKQLIELLMHTYRAGVDNPALLEVLAAEPLRKEELPAGDPDAGAAVTGLLEQIITLLRKGRLPAPQLAHTFRGLIGLIIGFILVQVDGLPLTGQPNYTDQADNSRLAAIEPTLRASDPAEGVKFNLELVLDGLIRRQTQPG